MKLPIDHLVANLRSLVPPGGPSGSDPCSHGTLGGDPVQLLREYAQGHDDWRKYALFDAGSYTRNLIESNPYFELIVLCWGEGQTSPVHNHSGQHCWMTVLDGEMEEERYEHPTTPGPLSAVSQFAFQAGEVAFIRDEIGLHVVRPALGASSVSLHLYAAPIPECNCYCEETGAVSKRTMSFHTVRGERVYG